MQLENDSTARLRVGERDARGDRNKSILGQNFLFTPIRHR